VDANKWWGKAKATVSSDSRAVQAEANQRFVRETLVQRQPQYARAVERAAEALVRDLAQRGSASQDAIVAEVREALATAA
jgi:hypothetical protein